MFAGLINHSRMDFILMRRHRCLAWPPAHCHPTPIYSYADPNIHLQSLIIIRLGPLDEGQYTMRVLP